MKTRVLLYNPRSEFYAMPLGLLAVGSALDGRRYDVRIVDGRLSRDAHQRVADQLDGALCLGMTVFTGSPIRDALQLAAAAKARRPGLPVVWGGWHPSILPDQCLESGLVDAVVLGQGEETFCELVERLRDGRGLRGCAGCVYLEDGVPVHNPARPFRNVNQFPAADYTLLPVEAYFQRKGRRQIDYASSRGCPYRCTFCADPQVYGGRWSGLDPERVLGELLELRRRYEFEEVFFLDDDLFANRRRLAELVRLFCRAGFAASWKGTARADELCRLSDETLETIRRSGCRRINVGAESGSQTLLDRIQKKYQVAELVEAGRRCHRFGIKLTFSFIAGFPSEPAEALDQTIGLIRTLKGIDPDFETPIYFYAPYPGTALSAELEENGWRAGRRLEDWFAFDIHKERYPWTSAGYVRRVRNLNFYLQKAYPGSAHRGRLRRLLGQLARWRLDHEFYAWPLERHTLAALRQLRAHT